MSDDVSTTPRGPALRGTERRAAVSGSLGSALEYFDFAIYGALSATLFPQLFFSGLGATGGVLASFATFSVGFVARPLGALVFGHLGDRFGRRPILYVTLLIMGLSSVVIGLLPTGQGLAVAVVLVALRFLQGFSLGGETTGNQLLMMEHAERSRRGVMGSFVSMGSPLSQVVANIVLVVLTSTLDPEQWASWGWRVPFLSSVLLVAVAVYMRLKIEETPAFVAQVDADTTAVRGTSGRGWRVLLTHPREVIQLTLVWGGPSLSFYIVTVYGLNLLTDQVGLTETTTFVILLIANGVSVFACIAGGLLSDRMGRKKALLGGLAGCIVGVALFFSVVPSGSVVLIALAVTFALSAIQFIAGIQPAFYAEQFPTRSRFSGSALSFTLGKIVFSGPGPLVAAALAGAAGTSAVMWYVLGVLALSVLALVKVTERNGIDLAAFPGTELRQKVSVADD